MKEGLSCDLYYVCTQNIFGPLNAELNLPSAGIIRSSPYSPR